MTDNKSNPSVYNSVALIHTLVLPIFFFSFNLRGRLDLTFLSFFLSFFQFSSFVLTLLRTWERKRDVGEIILVADWEKQEQVCVRVYVCGSFRGRFCTFNCLSDVFSSLTQFTQHHSQKNEFVIICGGGGYSTLIFIPAVNQLRQHDAHVGSWTENQDARTNKNICLHEILLPFHFTASHIV